MPGVTTQASCTRLTPAFGDNTLRSMINRSALATLAIAAAMFLAACGGGEESVTLTDVTPIESAADSTAEAPAETVTEAPAASDATTAVDAGQDPGGCDQLLTPAEIDSIFGTSIDKINGAGQFCNIVFAGDAVGSLAVFSGSKADEAIDTLLAQFQADGATGGVLLADGRGYVLDATATVRGDSGRVFRFDAPENITTPDLPSAMQNLADLLLTR